MQRSGCPPWNNLLMRPNPRTTPRRKAARAGSFKRLACVTCALLASLWAAVHYSGDISALFQSPAIPQENEHQLLDGSVLFFPLSGNTCRQSLIDHATGQIRDNGFVDCDAAKAQIAENWRKHVATQRQTVIRDSFFNK